MQQHQSAALAEPSFTLEDYFSGYTQASGLFVDRFGSIRRQFSVDIHGYVDDDKLILDEDFTFDDGEQTKRIWRITPLGRGQYIGTADDVVGTAKGQITGNRLRWTYDFNLTVGKQVWRVHLDDVMLLQANQMLLNRASMTKFGITIGEIIIAFQQDSSPAAKRLHDVDHHGHADDAGRQRSETPFAAATM